MAVDAAVAVHRDRIAQSGVYRRLVIEVPIWFGEPVVDGTRVTAFGDPLPATLPGISAGGGVEPGPKDSTNEDDGRL